MPTLKLLPIKVLSFRLSLSALHSPPRLSSYQRLCLEAWRQCIGLPSLDLRRPLVANASLIHHNPCDIMNPGHHARTNPRSCAELASSSSSAALRLCLLCLTYSNKTFNVLLIGHCGNPAEQWIIFERMCRMLASPTQAGDLIHGPKQGMGGLGAYAENTCRTSFPIERCC